MYEKLLQNIEKLSSEQKAKYDCLLALRKLQQEGSITLGDPNTDNVMRQMQTYFAGAVEKGTKGMLWWKKEVYRLSPIGVKELRDESKKIRQVQREIGDEELSFDLDGKVDALLATRGIPLEDLVIKKLLLQGKFDYKEIGYFTKKDYKLKDDITMTLGIEQERSAGSFNRNSKVKEYVSSAMSDNQPAIDNNSLFLWYLLMSDGGSGSFNSHSSPSSLDSGSNHSIDAGFSPGVIDSSHSSGADSTAHGGCGGGHSGCSGGGGGCGGGGGGGCGGGGCGGGCGGG